MTIRTDSGTEPQLSFVTMCSDGVLIASPPCIERFPLAPGGVVHVGAGHGAWQPVGADKAMVAFEAQGVLANGDVVGIGRVEGNLAQEDDGRFTGTYSFGMTNTSGETIATDSGTVDGRRIAAERKYADMEVATAD